MTTGTDSGEARPQHLRIDECAVVSDDVGELSPVAICLWAFQFEPNVAANQKGRQMVARLRCKRSRCVEPKSQFRSVDAEEAHAPDAGDDDGVSVNHVLDG